MTREEAKGLLPIIKAFTEGRTIQSKRRSGDWVDIEINNTLSLTRLRTYPKDYRIKPKPKYRPFANADECWQEMQKHKPFGWIKKISGHCNFLYIMELYSTGIVINDVDIFGGFKNLLKTYNFAFAETTFADGTPFGIREE